jgi:hypothetical protein
MVGRLLRVTQNEEDVFWLFCQIIEHILPLNFYSELAGLMIDTDITISLLVNYFPDLMAYLEDMQFIHYFKNILLQWYVSLFVQNFNLNSSIALWDVLFLEGSVVLFKTVIGLVKLIKDDLVKINSLEGFKNFIQNYFLGYKDISNLYHLLILRKFEFAVDLINKNRNLLERHMINLINDINQIKIKKLKEKIESIKTECMEIWPICVYDSESNYRIVDYFVYRNVGGPVVYDDYLDDKNLKIRKNKKKTYVDFESILIERKKHCCGKMLKKRQTVVSEFTLETDDSNNLSTDDTRSNKSAVDVQTDEPMSKDFSKDDSVISSNSSSGTKSIDLLIVGFKAKHNKCMSTITYSQFVKSKDNDFSSFISDIYTQCIG